MALNPQPASSGGVGCSYCKLQQCGDICDDAFHEKNTSDVKHTSSDHKATNLLLQFEINTCGGFPPCFLSSALFFKSLCDESTAENDSAGVAVE